MMKRENSSVPNGLGRYTVLVLLAAVLCGGACVYALLDTDPFAPWFAAITGICCLGLAGFGWALASMWWYGVKGVHPKWSLVKPSSSSN